MYHISHIIGTNYLYIYIYHFKVDRPKTPDIYTDLHAPTLFFKFILLALIHRPHVLHWNVSIANSWFKFKLNILLHLWVSISSVGKVVKLVKSVSKHNKLKLSLKNIYYSIYFKLLVLHFILGYPKTKFSLKSN